MVSFSQPAKPDQLLLSSQMTQGTQASQTPLQRLVKRMTRMLVKTSLEDTMTHLEALFNKLSYTYRCHANVVRNILMLWYKSIMVAEWLASCLGSDVPRGKCLNPMIHHMASGTELES